MLPWLSPNRPRIEPKVQRRLCRVELLLANLHERGHFSIGAGGTQVLNDGTDTPALFDDLDSSRARRGLHLPQKCATNPS